MRRHLALLLLALAAASLAHADAADKPDLNLHGEVTGKDNQTYRPVPFDVPAGTTRITVQFDYDNKTDHTTIDLGLLGPDGFRGQDGFRGWSGGTKRLFTVSATDATPSYLPGAIRPGRWQLLLGLPNVRPNARTAYDIKIWFGHAGDPAWKPDVLNLPLREGTAWYRGDLHMHTAHSDGQCDSQSGKRVSCPLFLTVQAAVAKHLDFIAITDHNTVSHITAMRELQPYFDQLLLIPGREITTFTGHANLFGSTEPLDFRVGSKEVPDWNAVADAGARLHGLLSINHAIRPSGEICMGCGWTPKPAIDMHKVQAVEIVNDSDAGSDLSGIPFWEQQLNAGYRVTGIGGSDNHNATATEARPGSSTIGRPTTVVHADALSMPAILEGVRAGHVFVDVQGSGDRVLEYRASSAGNEAAMGDSLKVKAGEVVRVVIHATHAADGHAVAVLDGKPLPLPADGKLAGDDAKLSLDWTSDGKPHWLRVEVRGADNLPWLYGNPIYVNR
jgi:hypothetical protein